MIGTAGLGRAIQGLILSFPVALFSLGTATDAAYLRTAQMQWSNFSSWAIVGGLVFGGAAFVWWKCVGTFPVAVFRLRLRNRSVTQAKDRE